MNTIKQIAAVTAVAALVLMTSTAASAKKNKALSPEKAKAQQAYALGVQAYIWGYPMVVMQKSRDAMTKGGEVPVTADQFNKSGLLFAPVNQVATAWGMLGPKFSAVQSGNSDTQYSVRRPRFSWTQISEEYDVQGGRDEQEEWKPEGYAGGNEGSP
jgi:hypothetical protein